MATNTAHAHGDLSSLEAHQSFLASDLGRKTTRRVHFATRPELYFLLIGLNKNGEFMNPEQKLLVTAKTVNC